MKRSANRGVAIEVAHLIGGLVITWLVFRAAAWGYPEGSGVVRPIGWLTMAAVAAMGVPEILRAYRNDAAQVHGKKEIG